MGRLEERGMPVGGGVFVGTAGWGETHLPSGGRRSSSCSVDGADDRISHVCKGNWSFMTSSRN